jgi:cytoskeletal protein CcmA (bactofilin family)
VVILRAHWGGRIETSGKLVVHRKAAVRTAGARVVLGADIFGEFTGSLDCNGPVLLGPTAVWQGNLTAPRVELTPGAVVLGGIFRICPQRYRPPAE